MNIAQTILSQIKTIDAWALSAWGAEDLIAMHDGLKFKTSGMTPWKGHVYIRYNPVPDLYEVQFFRVRNAKIINDNIVKDVYAPELVSVIDKFVG
jgi:hypothetical protein